MAKKTYRYNPDTKQMELVYDSEASTDPAPDSEHHHFVRGDISEFVSPINGAVIGSRSDLRRHMKQHGVIATSELCPKELAAKAKERSLMAAGIHPKQKAARIEALRGAIEHVRNTERSRRKYG